MPDLHEVYIVDTKNDTSYGRYRYVATCRCLWQSSVGKIEDAIEALKYHFKVRTGMDVPGDIETFDNYKPYGKLIPKEVPVEPVNEPGPEPPSTDVVQASTELRGSVET